MRTIKILFVLVFSAELSAALLLGVLAQEKDWSEGYWLTLFCAEICIVMIALNLTRVFKAKA